MIKARASGSKVYLYFMKKARQARHHILRNSCSYISSKPYVVPSSEPSFRDGSDEGSHHMVLCRINKKLSLIITEYSLLSGALV